MRPIFNKKVVKKYNLWDYKQYTYALFTVDKVNNYGLEKKKIKENVEKKTWISAQSKRSLYLVHGIYAGSLRRTPHTVKPCSFL